ncbi:hypothetical protein [Teredinibacter sp. KSP-S5-2]|uniref:hypothetical protein n=1 Tax=Teredinibacter sp. KSP-S5-2 TaxID=3034506 RepID=UPI00293488BE|nr:hypothetical protein [Teredinibacter sp. KSP-S5-2]WNO10596.1 hypothetical protein P5V12_05355 [Teredinibacter sp. KSP-S5-2]
MVFAVVVLGSIAIRKSIPNASISLRNDEDGEGVVIEGSFDSKKVSVTEGYKLKAVENRDGSIVFNVVGEKGEEVLALKEGLFTESSIKNISRAAQGVLSSSITELDNIKSLEKNDTPKSVLYRIVEEPSAVKAQWYFFGMVIITIAISSVIMG